MTKDEFISANLKYRRNIRIAIQFTLAWLGLIVILTAVLGSILGNSLDGDENTGKIILMSVGLLPLISVPLFLNRSRNKAALRCYHCNAPLRDGISSAVAIATDRCSKCGKTLF